LKGREQKGMMGKENAEKLSQKLSSGARPVNFLVKYWAWNWN
jgi:hypothetical protein